jgi:thiol-disulfide isomerase/thioredoxin/phosphohistidine phosphatase SixA
LAHNDIAAVIASPLQRAQETATPIAAAHGLVLGTDDQLIVGELFRGQADVARRRGLEEPAGVVAGPQPAPSSWGEPYKEIAARMTAAVHQARDLADGREVVCVSHQLPVETLRRSMEGKWLPHDPRRRQCNLASLTLRPSTVISSSASTTVSRRLTCDRSGLAYAVVTAAAILLTGCSTGHDAVAQGGTFEFIAPGGKTDILYDPPQTRGPARPQRTGPDGSTKTLSLDDFAGKVVVVNVWGQWCGPCRTEIGQLQDVYEATRAKGSPSWASTSATTTATPPWISSRIAGSPSRRSTTRRCGP